MYVCICEFKSNTCTHTHTTPSSGNSTKASRDSKGDKGPPPSKADESRDSSPEQGQDSRRSDNSKLPSRMRRVSFVDKNASLQDDELLKELAEQPSKPLTAEASCTPPSPPNLLLKRRSSGYNVSFVGLPDSPTEKLPASKPAGSSTGASATAIASLAAGASTAPTSGDMDVGSIVGIIVGSPASQDSEHTSQGMDIPSSSKDLCRR